MREVTITNFENYTINDNGDIFNKKGKRICQWIDNVGYYQVKLFKDNKWYYKRVHRLVAQHFVDNPNDFPQVNHIDGNKRNNKAINLEYISNKENTQHGYDNGLYHSKRRSIKIEVYSKNNEYISTYKSIRETANRLGINRKTLSRILFDNKTNNYNYNFKVIEL